MRRRAGSFGEKGLCNACNRINIQPVDQVLDGIIEQVRDCSGMLKDDIVLLGIKWSTE